MRYDYENKKYEEIHVTKLKHIVGFCCRRFILFHRDLISKRTAFERNAMAWAHTAFELAMLWTTYSNNTRIQSSQKSSTHTHLLGTL